LVICRTITANVSLYGKIVLPPETVCLNIKQLSLGQKTALLSQEHQEKKPTFNKSIAETACENK